jgi:hypothetical protein
MPNLTVVGEAEIGPPKPPRALGAHGQRLWDRIHADVVLNDAASLELLAQACSALDRLEELAASIAARGAVNKVGKLNECVRMELTLRKFVTVTLGKLGLTVDPLKDIGRPPSAY